MTSRLSARMAAESESIARRAELEAAMKSLPNPSSRFAVAIIGSWNIGDSGAPSSRGDVLIDDAVDTVDPARIVFLASISMSDGRLKIEVVTREGLSSDMARQFAEWCHGWYAPELK